MTKKIYRVRNWEEYNKGLVQRGSLTFWFSQEVIEGWRIEKNKDSHGNQKYSDMVILCGLTLRQLFRIPLRATEGMLQSLIELMHLKVNAPDYSTLSRRGKKLKGNLGIKENTKARHILVDSTGVQVIEEVAIATVLIPLTLTLSPTLRAGERGDIREICNNAGSTAGLTVGPSINHYPYPNSAAATNF